MVHIWCLSASTIKWGIIGSGKISADFCAALKQNPEAQIVAVAARDASRAAAFGQGLGVSNPVASHAGYASLVEPIASSSRNHIQEESDGPEVTCVFAASLTIHVSQVNDPNVDVIYIGNINTEHFDAAMMAIAAGKATVVEKPITLNGTQTRKLAAAAKEANVFLMEGLWSRFFPATQKALSVIESGELGKVIAVHADFGFRCDDANDSRMFDLAMGGGGLLDIGIYPLSFASMAYEGGMPSIITAVGSLHPETGADTSAAIAAVYGGQKGVASVTYNLRGHTPEEVVIVGESARLRIASPAHVPSTVVVTKPDGREAWSDETFHFKLPDADPSHSYFYPGSQGFAYQITEVHNCLRQVSHVPRSTHLDPYED